MPGAAGHEHVAVGGANDGRAEVVGIARAIVQLVPEFGSRGIVLDGKEIVVVGRAVLSRTCHKDITRRVERDGPDMDISGGVHVEGCVPKCRAGGRIFGQDHAVGTAGVEGGAGYISFHTGAGSGDHVVEEIGLERGAGAYPGPVEVSLRLGGQGLEGEEEKNGKKKGFKGWKDEFFIIGGIFNERYCKYKIFYTISYVKFLFSMV